MFFTITGKFLLYLLDSENGNKPHQRKEAKQKSSASPNLPESILSKINRVFDTAFEIKIDSRWQSIPAVMEALIDILELENSEGNKAETFLEKIKNKLSSDSNIEKKLFRKLAEKVIEQITQAVRSLVYEDLDSNYFYVCYRGATKRLGRIDWANLKFSQQVTGISCEFSNENFFPEFQGYVTGNEFVLVSSIKGKKVELLRTSLIREPDFTDFAERLRKFYAEGVESIISN
ncbi:hypothetical protein ACP6PL_15905 [Dapis sp. BLCC M126]|uniref:hypothetical protein n=1 Tax=Dapis sp. BLCC M126 TaxID=3400189 RepID=UPI003CE752DF